MAKVTDVNGFKYKFFEIGASPEKGQISELNKFFAFFPKEDIFFTIEQGKIIVFLRQIDLKEFEGKARDFTSIKEVIDEILRRIHSIKSYGIKNGKRVYVDYDKERKVKLRKEKEEERGKYFYALSHGFYDKNNALPSEFENKIICGDSEDVLKKFPDNCVDLIFTSPPYNFGLEYENHKDAESWDKYLNKLFAIFDECIRVLKFGGRIVVNVQPLFSDYIPLHHIISNFFMNRKLIWKGEIIWEKHNYNCKYTAWGSWKSPSNPYLKYTWEFLEIFSKGSLTHKGETNETDLTADEFKKWVYARWDIAPERNMKKWGHPAMFPEELARRVIKLFSFKGDIVLDPFNGVGTTTKVAKELGRRFIGIDISEEYCKKAVQRLGDKKGKSKKLKEQGILSLFSELD
ncbi:DNA-methyltransferase [Candidatus Chrysopegis kryptomonas]|jgi:DNA modification methylase|uniref:Methyltransferase n=1 Tax=Candidatus Chryseopegocella kryptomonas TaxID=1633643 RepID=A0A0N7MWI7_9BACT|nr:site-specific DNA-methyltransferase [Candidatus Chrysopegis kryptomonas]CUS98755.1 DNA modification methylase [Candidatus Chrysopegis kryptomonas]